MDASQKVAEFGQLAEMYEKKWAPLLGNLKGYERSVCAILLENQLDQCSKDRVSNGILSEATVTGDIAGPERVLLPIVRRFYPALVANKLVGVQPMTTPSSLVFYLRYFYSTNKGRTSAGNEFLGINPQAYENFVYDPYYSSEELELDLRTLSIAGNRLSATALLSTDDLAKNKTFLDQLGSGNSVTTNGWGAYLMSVSDPGSTGTGEVDYKVDVNTITIDKTSGVVTLAFATAIPSGTVLNDEITVYAAGDFEARADLPEVDLRILSQPIAAKTRKLKTKWSNEAEQDMRIIHNIDAEKELVSLLSNEVALEIDREILRDLLLSAATKEVYDYSSVSRDFNYTNPAKGMADRIVQLANKIYKYTKLGVGNWVVTSPEISAKLETLEGFEAAPSGISNNTGNFGIVYCGKLGKKMDIYKDALFPTSKALIGYKGDNFMQSGYFYAPYVPVQMSPTVIDPEDFTPRKALMTRYGKIMVDGGQFNYASLNVRNLV